MYTLLSEGKRSTPRPISQAHHTTTTHGTDSPRAHNIYNVYLCIHILYSYTTPPLLVHILYHILDISLCRTISIWRHTVTGVVYHYIYLHLT